MCYDTVLAQIGLKFGISEQKGGNKMGRELLSPCCNVLIVASLGDGVVIGICSECGKDVIRLNPKTGQQEWLDGNSPWTDKALRPVSN